MGTVGICMVGVGEEVIGVVNILTSKTEEYAPRVWRTRLEKPDMIYVDILYIH